ncbi:hypothetical protein K438DRAFT_445538 [Mycena galopus ATCC 62051]|nr:hypothetical protein K438DRAFT_445538 [Mycena galopus ATCC 62051]
MGTWGFARISSGRVASCDSESYQQQANGGQGQAQGHKRRRSTFGLSSRWTGADEIAGHHLLHGPRQISRPSLRRHRGLFEHSNR